MNHEQRSVAEQDALDILTQLTQEAAPAVFADSRIAENYQAGFYTTRLDAEVDDVLQRCRSSQDALPIAVTDSVALAHLNALVLIQNGEVLPVLDIERLDIPLTRKQRIRLYSAAARTLLDAVADILEDRAATLSHEQCSSDRDEEQGNGVLC